MPWGSPRGLSRARFPRFGSAAGGQQESELAAIEAEATRIFVLTQTLAVSPEEAVNQLIQLHQTRVMPLRKKVGLVPVTPPAGTMPAVWAPCVAASSAESLTPVCPYENHRLRLDEHGRCERCSGDVRLYATLQQLSVALDNEARRQRTRLSSRPRPGWPKPPSSCTNRSRSRTGCWPRSICTGAPKKARGRGSPARAASGRESNRTRARPSKRYRQHPRPVRMRRLRHRRRQIRRPPPIRRKPVSAGALVLRPRWKEPGRRVAAVNVSSPRQFFDAELLRTLHPGRMERVPDARPRQKLVVEADREASGRRGGVRNLPDRSEVVGDPLRQKRRRQSEGGITLQRRPHCVDARSSRLAAVREHESWAEAVP